MGMTLDEAIKHAEEVAEGHEKIKCIKAVTLEECKCAEEHRQLAEWLKDYKRLKEQELCEDSISREDTMTALRADPSFICPGDQLSAIRIVEGMPPVNPQQKTGHWIIIDDCEQFIAKCSECGRIEDSRMISKYLYCHCGAKMVEPQESEDKE